MITNRMYNAINANASFLSPLPPTLILFLNIKNAVIETITPSHDFCMGCTKLRVGCDGNLFGCLYRSDLGKNLKNVLKNHHSLAKYEQIVKQVVDTREPYY